MIYHGKEIKIFSGNSNREMAWEIAQILGVSLGIATVGKFSDGEISVSIGEVVRGADVFVIQSTCDPVNENLMELLIMIDALKRASAGCVTAVMPYFGYGRQDRKAKARDPISAKLVSNLLTSAGVDRVLTMDFHVPQIQGFFDIPVDHLEGGRELAQYFFKALPDLDSAVAVSPDAGSANRTRKFAQYLDLPIAIVDKRRPAHNVAEIVNIIGDVKGKVCIIIDDLIDTGGTVINTANMLMEYGATDVYATCSHGVLSGNAVSQFSESCIKELVLLNTIPLPEGKKNPKFRQLSVSKLFAEAIDRIYGCRSISTLFDRRQIRFDK
ncbi:MAG: ribose-phosphate pyrophosphokinase [Oscillospiraceae bacterium]|nr:ribose-phosphate pyrophosphokinase [Oscillospiraceae bacterium]